MTWTLCPLFWYLYAEQSPHGVKRQEHEAERVHHVPRSTSVELRLTSVMVCSSE